MKTLFLITALLATPFVSLLHAAEASKPNIVLILADDKY